MPRLLLAATVPRTLGAFLVPFARNFRARGWRVDALSGAPLEPAAAAEFDAAHVVAWSRSPLSPANLGRAPRQVRRIVEAGGYDLVHVHTPVAGFVLRLALRRGAAPVRPAVIYTAHGFHFHEGGHPLSNALYLGLERLAGRWTDRLVVINRDDEAAALRHGIVPRERLTRMPGIGVDLVALSPEQVAAGEVEAARRSLGLPPGAPYLLMVAELNPGKRHRDLLQALVAIPPPARLVLAGEGPLLRETRARAAALGIAERVHFAGFRRDVPALMRGAAAVVLPSEREGLPRSLLEAMALGVPVVATRTRGCAELLEGGCGALVPVGDAAALAAALRALLDDPVAAAAAARRARERVEGYALPEVIRLHEELYEGALATR